MCRSVVENKAHWKTASLLASTSSLLLMQLPQRKSSQYRLHILPWSRTGLMLNHYYKTVEFQSLTYSGKKVNPLKTPSRYSGTGKQMQGEKLKPHLVLVRSVCRIPGCTFVSSSGDHSSVVMLKVNEVEVFIKAHD